MDENFMRAYYAIYNSEDPDKLESLYHPDVILRNGDIEIVGRERLLATYQEMIRNFDDKMSPSSIRVEANAVVVDILDRLRARHDVTDFMGQSVREGEVLELRLRGRYEFEDQRIRRITLELVG